MPYKLQKFSRAHSLMEITRKTLIDLKIPTTKHHYFFFFFNDTATPEIYTLSLHDALPIYQELSGHLRVGLRRPLREVGHQRSESLLLAHSVILHRPWVGLHHRLDHGQQGCLVADLRESVLGHDVGRSAPRFHRLHQHLASLVASDSARRHELYEVRQVLGVGNLARRGHLADDPVGHVLGVRARGAGPFEQAGEVAAGADQHRVPPGHPPARPHPPPPPARPP